MKVKEVKNKAMIEEITNKATELRKLLKDDKSTTKKQVESFSNFF